jgi:hypothetical protein
MEKKPTGSYSGFGLSILIKNIIKILLNFLFKKTVLQDFLMKILVGLLFGLNQLKEKKQ